MANNMINSFKLGEDVNVFTLPYGVCSTEAETAIKEVTVDNFKLEAGAIVVVKFTKSNSASKPQLKVNDNDAKPIMRYGTTVASTGTTTTGWAAGAVQVFIYDGTNWIRDYWSNTTYSNFVKSGSGAKAGLVPAPSTTTGTTKYLREDGTWQVPPDTNTTYAFATGDNNGEIKITPSGSSAFNVAIKGLNTAAYVSSATFASASHTHDYAPTSHTHSYVAKSGDTMTGNLMMKSGNPYIGFQNASGSTKGYVQYVASSDVYGIGAGIANSLVITSTGSIQIPKNQSFTPSTSGGTGTIGTSNNVWQSMYATTFIGNLSGTATKVSKDLTIGSKTYNGSSAISISASDLGLAQALKFVSSVSSLPSTTSGYSIGDVILVGNKEYVCTASNTWTELGDGSSYAFKTTTVTGTNGLTGGGALSTNQTISANLVSNTKLSNAASAATETAGRVYPVAMDKNGKLAVNVPWTDTKVTQAAAITTNGAYPIILGYSTASTAVTNTLNKTTTLTYNPSTQTLNTTKLSFSNAVTLSYNSADKSLDFIFA